MFYINFQLLENKRNSRTKMTSDDVID